MRAKPFIKACGVGVAALAIGLFVTKSSADAPAGRYVLSSGTVRDTKTELVWALSTLGMNTFANAQTGCANLTLNESYWRLPSMKEIQTLVDPTGIPHLDLTAFGAISTGGTAVYWTSSSVVGSVAPEYWSLTWYSDGYPQLRPWNYEQTAYIRCVRVGPRPPTDGGTDAPLPPTTMFKEDLEDGAFDGWTFGTTGPSAYTVTTTQAAAGTTQSLQVRGGSWYAGANRMFGPFQPAHVSFWLRIAAGTQAGTGTFALSSNSSASQNIVQFYALESYFLFAGDAQLSTRTTITAELNRWYHIEMDLNWTTKRFIARIDGAMVGEAGFGSNTATSLTRIDIFNSGETGNVFFDEIELGP